MAKQKNQTDSNTKKKNKKKITSKKLLSGPNTIAMKSKSPLENPFETIWTRRKFDVVGKKRKGEEKRIGMSREVAIKKREGLRRDFHQNVKSSTFVDKRIGEKNDELGEFEKGIIRFQRERQLKLKKQSKFNLSDGEDDDETLGGGSFAERDDFEDDMLAYDDPDGDETKKNKPLRAHRPQNPLESGSTERDENKQKTKKEVMEEIISKSKHFKELKAKDKEENEQLMEELDQNFASLVESKALLSMTQPGKMNALKALLNKGKSNESVKEDALSAPTKRERDMQDQPDAYDKLVKEMVLDMRARPSDRTKTPEEIAQEERERLEELEEERQKRMLEGDDSGDEGSDGRGGSNKVSSQKVKSISGDDLGDSFSLVEEAGNRKGWVDEILEREGHNISEEGGSASSEESDGDEEDDVESDQEDGEEDNNRTAKAVSLKDWEQSDDDTVSSNSEEIEEDSEGDESEGNDALDTKQKTNIQTKETSAGKQTKSKQLPTKKETLPFVIEAPNSLEEFCALLENRSGEEIIEAINRIRACNAVRLASENRKKMQVFYGILLQYFAVLATKNPLNFNLLNLLVKPLVDMSADTPFFAAICARERIMRIRNQFCEDIKHPEKSCWPSLKTLFLLRLWSIIFPCSDFRHAVMTPVILLMCEYLMRCPITSGRDIAIGSFLCSMVLSVSKHSQKFCPEALIFIRSVLTSALKTEKSLPDYLQAYNFSEVKRPRAWLLIQDHEPETEPLDFLEVIEMNEDSPFFSSDKFRASMLASITETLQGFVHIYGGYKSFPEIFSPISTLLREILKQENIPDTLQDKIKNVDELIGNKVDVYHSLRQPLQMRKQKPVPIKLVNPKFEDNFVKGRDYDPDRDRVEQKKLKKLVERERKGARRELKIDNLVLQQEKEKRKSMEAEERSEKYGQAMNFLQAQESAFKSGQLGKGGSKKRRR